VRLSFARGLHLARQLAGLGRGLDAVLSLKVRVPLAVDAQRAGAIAVRVE